MAHQKIDYEKLHNRRRTLELRLKFIKTRHEISPFMSRERKRFKAELTIIYSMLAARRGRLHYQYLY